jgi:CEP76 C2 domain
VQTANTIAQSQGAQDKVTAASGRKLRSTETHDQIDPNKRYMSLTLVRGSAFADFVNVRTDESVSVAVSFLKNRYHTRMVQCSTDPLFDETFLFEFVGNNDQIKFDAANLLKLNQPIHITILKHRKNEKAVVIGTKSIEWRPLLFCNQVEINAEVLPISLTQKGSLGVLTLHLDLVPNLSQSELINEDAVNK